SRYVSGPIRYDPDRRYTNWMATTVDKPVVARNARELAGVLGLTPADGLEIEIRSDLNDKIIEVVRKRGLTHDQVATLAHTSRTRITAILNRNTQDISTETYAAGAGFSPCVGQAGLGPRLDPRLSRLWIGF
ncbi:MAG: hypothetical protein ACRD8U_18575, partial [Pyrinomonadaceae bacterium]